MRTCLRAGLFLAFYGAVVVWLTWPLAAHVGTSRLNVHSLCRVDTVYMTWVLADETHALTSAPSHILQSNIYHPARDTLFYGQVALGLLPYFAPTFILTGNATLAFNLAFLTCVVLTAWSVHLVAARWTGSTLAGLIAGWTILTNRYLLWFVPIEPHFVVLQYLAPIVFLTAAPEGGMGRRVLLLALVVLQCLTDPVYVAPGVLGSLGLVAVVRAFRPGGRPRALRLLGLLAAAVVLLLPVYLGYAAIRAREPDLLAQTPWEGRLPDSLDPLPWRFIHNTTAIPLVVLPLLLLGGLGVTARAVRGQVPATGSAWLHAGLFTAAGRLATLTPDWGVLRATDRLGTCGTVGVALLAGLAFAECAGRLRGRYGGAAVGLACALGVAMYGDYRHAYLGPELGRGVALPADYPLTEVTPPDPGLITALRYVHGPVIELPIAAMPFSPAFHAVAMYRSTYHWHPLLNGYSSYWPVGFPERMELVRRLPEPGAVEVLHDRADLAAIIVRWTDMLPLERVRWLALVKSGGNARLRLAYAGPNDYLFAVHDSRIVH